MEELLQKKNFTKRRIRITPRELLYEVSRWGNVDETPIPFEDLTKSITNHQEAFSIWRYLNWLFLYFGVIWLFTGIVGHSPYASSGESLLLSLLLFLLAGFFFWMYKYTQEHCWKLRLTNGTYLFILKNVPSEENVDEFIETIYDRRDEYLIPVLGEINPRVNYETQLENLKFLQYLRVWEEKEYTAAKEKLDEACGQKPRAIGFGNHWQA